MKKLTGTKEYFIDLSEFHSSELGFECMGEYYQYHSKKEQWFMDGRTEDGYEGYVILVTDEYKIEALNSLLMSEIKNHLNTIVQEDIETCITQEGKVDFEFEWDKPDTSVLEVQLQITQDNLEFERNQNASLYFELHEAKKNIAQLKERIINLTSKK